MPIIAYTCQCGNITKKFIRLAPSAPASLTCTKCNQAMKRTLSAPSNVSKITIDNGVQAKAVEVMPNVIELMEERSNKNYSEE